MYARLVTGQAQPGKLDEFISTFRDTVLPPLKQERGFKGTYLLTASKTSKIVAVALWETEDDAKASETGYAQQRLPKVMHLLTGPPVSETYEVSIRA